MTLRQILGYAAIAVVGIAIVNLVSGKPTPTSAASVVHATPTVAPTPSPLTQKQKNDNWAKTVTQMSGFGEQTKCTAMPQRSDMATMHDQNSVAFKAFVYYGMETTWLNKETDIKLPMNDARLFKMFATFLEVCNQTPDAFAEQAIGAILMSEAGIPLKAE